MSDAGRVLLVSIAAGLALLSLGCGDRGGPATIAPSVPDAHGAIVDTIGLPDADLDQSPSGSFDGALDSPPAPDTTTPLTEAGTDDASGESSDSSNDDDLWQRICEVKLMVVCPGNETVAACAARARAIYGGACESVGVTLAECLLKASDPYFCIPSVGVTIRSLACAPEQAAVRHCLSAGGSP